MMMIIIVQTAMVRLDDDPRVVYDALKLKEMFS
jgi:hypothetical protein